MGTLGMTGAYFWVMLTVKMTGRRCLQGCVLGCLVRIKLSLCDSVFPTFGSAALCWQNEAEHRNKEKLVSFSTGMRFSFSPLAQTNEKLMLKNTISYI